MAHHPHRELTGMSSSRSETTLYRGSSPKERRLLSFRRLPSPMNGAPDLSTPTSMLRPGPVPAQGLEPGPTAPECKSDGLDAETPRKCERRLLRTLIILSCARAKGMEHVHRCIKEVCTRFHPCTHPAVSRLQQI